MLCGAALADNSVLFCSALQAFLIANGCHALGLGPDGKELYLETDGLIGPHTFLALQAFINRHCQLGITVDGNASAETWRALQIFLNLQGAGVKLDGVPETDTWLALQRFLNLHSRPHRQKTAEAESMHTPEKLAKQKPFFEGKDLRRFQLQLCCGVLLVGLAGFAFMWFACFCHDPAHGHPNDWNRIPRIPDSVINECGDWAPSRTIGEPWCCGVTAAVVTHVYVTLPVYCFLAKYCAPQCVSVPPVDRGGATAQGQL